MRRVPLILASAAVLAAAILAYMTYGLGGQEHVMMTIYADRTLQPALEEIVKDFKEYMAEKGVMVEVTFVYGSSGYALSQLKLHGRGDLYVADDEYFALIGVKEGVLDGDTLAELGYIRLTLVVPEGNPKGLSSLVEALNRSDVRVAFGNPEHVSAGVLASRLISELGLSGVLEELARSGRVIYVNSAAEAASYVMMGLADAAVTFNVYVTLYPDKLDEVRDPVFSDYTAPVVIAVPVNHGPYAYELYEYVKSHAEVMRKYGVEVPGGGRG